MSGCPAENNGLTIRRLGTGTRGEGGEEMEQALAVEGVEDSVGGVNTEVDLSRLPGTSFMQYAHV